MVSKKLLGIAVAGAFTLGGCGLIELADAIQDAAQDTVDQIGEAATKSNVKGALTSVASAFKGRDSLNSASEKMNAALAPSLGLAPQSSGSFDCELGGSLSLEDNSDDQAATVLQSTFTAENCVESDIEGTVEIDGTMTIETDSMTGEGSYSASIRVTVRDDADAIIEEFVFDGFSMEFGNTQFAIDGSMSLTVDGATDSVSYSDFTIVMEQSDVQSVSRYSIDGAFSFDLADASCSDGAFTFVTEQPIEESEGSDCPTAGVLTVNGITYTFAGDSVSVGSDTYTCAELLEESESSDDLCEVGGGSADSDDEFPEDDTSETM